ncbi:MAG: RNA 2',3'-cyclic phosphodiesterase [Candidatus Thorarchaeota archaeon]
MSDVLRVFLSIDIDDKTLLSKVKEIQSKLDRDSAKMKLVEEENIHFTWRFFGDTPSRKIDSIYSEMSKLEHSSFDIQIQGVGAFPNIRHPRVIWIGVTDNEQQMQQLKSETDLLLSNVGYNIEKQKFTPHATIARVRFVKDKDRLFRCLEALEPERIGSMKVDTIRLTKSTLTSSGPIYETLWEIPLE